MHWAKAFLFLTSLTFSFQCLALSIEHPHFIPFIGESILTLGAGNGHREIEYQNGGIVIDEQVYKFNESHFSYTISPWDYLALGISINYDFDREYELKFGPGSNRFGDEPYRSSTTGFIDPEVFFVYDFQPFKESWSQQIYLRGNPFDIREEPRKSFRGGHDIFLKYRFSKNHETADMYGELFSHYFGKKHYYLPGDSRISISEAYTEVGIKVGYLHRNIKDFSFFIEGSFAMSSDFEVISPEVRKTADKGFIIEGGLGANYLFSKKSFAQVVFIKKSRIYNATNENIIQDIDYEIEEYSINFNLSFVFGDLKE